jgi:hypothetical protein
MALVLAGLAFALCGVPMLWLAMRAFARDRAIARWPRASGTVQRSWLEKSTSRVTDKNTGLHSYSDYYTPKVHYTYSVGAEIFDGTSISLADDGVRTSHDSAKRVIDRYPAGAKVEVLHDPADPKSSHLETSRSVGGIILFAFGLVLFLLGAALVVLASFSS